MERAAGGGLWRAQVGKLAPGDRIDVSTHDYEIQYELSIIRVSDDPEDLKMFTRVLYPTGLTLPPVVEGGKKSRFVLQRTGFDLYSVVDLRPGAR